MPKLRFHISYHTVAGEYVAVEICRSSGETSLVGLTTTDGHSWLGAVEVRSEADSLYYNYCVCRADGAVVRREASRRKLPLGRRTRLFLDDNWDDGCIHSAFCRSAFTECVFRPQQTESLSAAYLLTVKALPAPENWHWAIVGSSAQLGEWDVEKALRLKRTDTYEWSVALNSVDFRDGLEYKYIMVSDYDNGQVRWEDDENRRIAPLLLLERNEAVLRTDCAPRIDWQPWRGAGVVIPLFSLRSEGSFGVGDFGDLEQLVRWAASTGLRAVQLLPINDTTTTGTWHDSYPYSGISVFALHPLYLDLREWKDTAAYQKRKAKGEQLNALSELDYEAAFHEKMDFLRELFAENGATVLKNPRFKTFKKENARWLDAYCRFSRLRDEHHTANSRDWPEQDFEAAAPKTKTQRSAEDFYAYVQYLLHRQMSRAHDTARSLGVILKGDIPIGICRDSVPAWADGHLFHFNGQAGAPPDAFARHGQNWGFPTYNWDAMSKDGYAWWRERFRHMGRYFDAYRIDHVLGFFRIWEIPYEQEYGLLGRFRPALPFSEDEIRGYGFTSNVSEMARPLLTPARFEELAEEVGGNGLLRFFESYTAADGRQMLALKPEYATQRKVRAAVGDEALRNVLLDVVAEVLFIEDDAQPGHYHPRIGAQDTHRFLSLPESERYAFNRLHDDFFYARHNIFWADEAMKKLPAIIGEDEACEKQTTSPLLPCAEDLGMVPSSVKGVLEKLNVLSLEIQRMPKRYGVRFDNLSENPWLSVSTIATHDMPPFRLWWREDAGQTQAFWRDVLGRSGDAPAEASPEVCELVVAKHLGSPSMLCLLALQDLLAIDGNLRHPDPAAEQINVPSCPNHYWRYRMHLTLEQLAAATGFNEKLRALVLSSGRNV